MGEQQTRTRRQQPCDLLLAALERAGGCLARERLADAAGLSERTVATALARLESTGDVLTDDAGSVRLAAPAQEAEPPEEPAEDRPEYRVRIRETRTIGRGPYQRRIQIEIDDSVPQSMVDESRAALEKSYQEEREKLGLPPEKRRARLRAAKEELLTEHAREHGTGISGWESWNARCREEGHPDSWRYATRNSYNRAARRLVRDLESRQEREILLAMGLTRCEVREGPNGPTYKWT